MIAVLVVVGVVVGGGVLAVSLMTGLTAVFDQVIEYRIGVLPGVTTRWLTEITHVRELEYFVDEQRVGPYRLSHHEHHFAATPDGRGVVMTDRVTYEVGFGPIGEVLHAAWIGRQLKTIFDYRAARIAELFSNRRD